MGLLYLLDGDNGFVKRFFPLQFHEIQVRIPALDAADCATGTLRRSQIRT